MRVFPERTVLHILFTHRDRPALVQPMKTEKRFLIPLWSPFIKDAALHLFLKWSICRFVKDRQHWQDRYGISNRLDCQPVIYATLWKVHLLPTNYLLIVPNSPEKFTQNCLLLSWLSDGSKPLDHRARIVKEHVSVWKMCFSIIAV